jgi:hypothetical protein
MKAIYFRNYKKYDTLKSFQGRIVLYKENVGISEKSDYSQLIQQLSSSAGVDEKEVEKNAIRLYYTKDQGMLVVSKDRDFDEEELLKNKNELLNLIIKKFPR